MSKDGFTFEGTGTLERIDERETKGKVFLTAIVRVDGKYPQLVPIKLFGDCAEDARKWQVGAPCRVTGRLGGRDWQGRVFGDIVAETFSCAKAQPAVAAPPADDPYDGDVPF